MLVIISSFFFKGNTHATPIRSKHAKNTNVKAVNFCLQDVRGEKQPSSVRPTAFSSGHGFSATSDPCVLHGATCSGFARFSSCFFFYLFFSSRLSSQRSLRGTGAGHRGGGQRGLQAGLHLLQDEERGARRGLCQLVLQRSGQGGLFPREWQRITPNCFTFSAQRKSEKRYRK